MGMDIHGIMQIRKSENSGWVTYDKYFHWFDYGTSRNSFLFAELRYCGKLSDDSETWIALREKIEKDFDFDVEAVEDVDVVCLTLTLQEMKKIKGEYDSDSDVYKFIEEVEELYDGNPNCFRIVYCFDW